jgi:hypothetical protein
MVFFESIDGCYMFTRHNSKLSILTAQGMEERDVQKCKLGEKLLVPNT